MSYCSKDYQFIGDRYINIKNTTAECGEIMWYERNIDSNTVPTECLICIEAESEMYTKYAHPKAHIEAHTQATKAAETLAIKEKTTEDYLSYYTFHYGREYIKIYKNLYDKYRNEYSKIVLGRTYDKNDRICDYHQDTIRFHYEFKEELPC